MQFRKATLNDIDEIMRIYSESREFMRETGNFSQWGNGYPARELILEDISGGNSIILEEEGEILAVFAMFDGPDKTYNIIKDGEWLSLEPYGVIHRIAVAKKGRGLSSLCFKYGMDRYKNIRIDTHENNLPMQKALIKNGFSRCGIIFLENGDERIAFQKIQK
ncbi:MAG: GNAT family N-acetyltransferase [Oscillospiraceae bacterium]|nr:GNAT family N-acetyltransferase [Oscillospiraceae bacterium]